MCDCAYHSGRLLSRRNLFAGGAALAAAASLRTSPGFAQTAGIGGDEALKRLMDGNARYVANTPNVRDYSARRAAAVAGQAPFAAILSCADSRVIPEHAFDQGQGDLFVVRLAGNFVDDDGLASLEYAVRFLGTRLIMVLGHSNCGAVDAAIKVIKENAELPGHLPDLIKSIKPAVEIARKTEGGDLLDRAISENVKLNAERVRSADPILSDAVKGQGLKVVGGVYELATGKVGLLA